MSDILGLIIWLLEQTPYGTEHKWWGLVNYVVFFVIGWQILYKTGIISLLVKLICKLLGCGGEVKLQHKPVKEHQIKKLESEIRKQELTIASLQATIKNMNSEIQNKQDKNQII